MSLQKDSEVFLIKEGFALPFLLKQPLPKATNSKALILLYGVGSNENDLFSLSNELPDNLLIISPRAPFTTGDSSYARYQVDFSNGTPVINGAQENTVGKSVVSGNALRVMSKKPRQHFSYQEL